MGNFNEDGVKDEKFEYYMGSLKNPIFRWGFLKSQYIRGKCLKSGPWTVCRFKGGVAKKRGWCFRWGGRGGDGLIAQECNCYHMYQESNHYRNMNFKVMN